MGSALGYALTGAAIGLGDDIVRRAEDKRAMARDLLKQRARTAERDEDRKLTLEDLSAKETREDAQRAEDFEFKRETLDTKEAGLHSRSRGLGKGKKLSPGVGFRLGRKLTELNDGLPPSEEEVEVVEDMVKKILKEANRNGVKMTEEEAEEEAISRMIQGEEGDFTGSFRPRGKADGNTEPKPMPASPDGLVVGEVYIHPKTGESVRWDGKRFTVIE